MNSRLIITIVVGATMALAALILLTWFFFFRSAPPLTNTPVNSGLGLATTQTIGGSSNTGDNTNQVAPLGGATQQKIFKIAEGPVTGATFVQTFNPTTTLARFVLQENGHVQDQPIDVPGSLPRAVSNTTIPGTARALWGGTRYLYLQYLDEGVVKTASLEFNQATSSRSLQPPRIQFLPDNITDLAPSPSGGEVAYLLQTSSGTDGYLANADGSNSRKLFSLGFKELLLSWPSTNTLLLTTKSNATASGVVFSVDVRTGGVVPRIHGVGLTAIADRAFSHVVYQAQGGGQARTSYLRSIARSGDVALSFNPIPEKCTWGRVASTTVFCAAPAGFVDSNYLDRWHQGVASMADLIVSFTLTSVLDTKLITTPGGEDGGVESDILEMAVSPDDKYLLFIKKGDRSLWGVRLGQN